MRIILIGFMCAGKTTIAKALAHELGFKYIDTDEVIELQENKSVAKIFAENGEEYFRNAEQKCLESLVNKKYIVVASGGGLPCNEINISLIINEFTSIYIQLPNSILISRLASKKNKRPLISKAENISETVEKLMAVRLPFYKKANIIIYAENKNQMEISSEIMGLI